MRAVVRADPSGDLSLWNRRQRQADARIIAYFAPAFHRGGEPDEREREVTQIGLGLSEDDPLHTQLLSDVRSEADRWLDEFQLRVSNDWRFRVRLGACTVAALIAGLALIVFPLTPVGSIGVVMGAFVFGGFFAGVARDLTSIPERRRGGSWWARRLGSPLGLTRRAAV